MPLYCTAEFRKWTLGAYDNTLHTDVHLEPLATSHAHSHVCLRGLVPRQQSWLLAAEDPWAQARARRPGPHERQYDPRPIVHKRMSSSARRTHSKIVPGNGMSCGCSRYPVYTQGPELACIQRLVVGLRWYSERLKSGLAFWVLLMTELGSSARVRRL